MNPLMPQIMNAIQQDMQVGMTSFHYSYTEQYHQPVMHHFKTLNANFGVVRSDVNSLTNQFGNPYTNVQNIQQQFTGFTDHFYNVFPRGPTPLGYIEGLEKTTRGG
jgi:hypothetical protein